jgi:hypothetical protein
MVSHFSPEDMAHDIATFSYLTASGSGSPLATAAATMVEVISSVWFILVFENERQRIPVSMKRVSPKICR